jgi:hypothetical protein
MLCPYEEGGRRDLRLCVSVGTGTRGARRIRIDEEKVLARELDRRCERGNKSWSRRVVLFGVGVDQKKARERRVGRAG